MRFLSGLILGFLLAIFVAYVHDTGRSGVPAEGITSQTLVNWDVFGRDVAAVNAWAQDQIARFSSQARRQG